MGNGNRSSELRMKSWLPPTGTRMSEHVLRSFGSLHTRLLGQYAYYRRSARCCGNSVRLGLQGVCGSHVGQRAFFPRRNFAPWSPSTRRTQRNVAVCSDPNDRSTCSDIRVPVGGNQLFILNSELRFPLPSRTIWWGALLRRGNVYHAVNIRSFVRTIPTR